MTIKEFYGNVNGDYEEIMHRLSSEVLVIHFVERFATDSTYSELLSAVAEGSISAGFEAAHKLKGIAANLSFTDLYMAVSALTEQLRPLCEPADKTLLQKVSQCYQAVMTQIALLKTENHT